MTLDTAINRYYNSIYTLIYGKTGKDKLYADECCNYIFFLFSIKADKLKDEIVYPWLLKTADNKLKEYFRQKEKDKCVISLEEVPFVLVDKTELVDRIITDRDIEAAKQKLLSLLSEEERQMYEDYFVHKLTYAEIANKLGIDRNTAAKRLHTIRKKLEEEASKVLGIAGSVTVLRIITALFDR